MLYVKILIKKKCFLRIRRKLVKLKVLKKKGKFFELSFLMEIYMKESYKAIRFLDKENWFFKMGRFLKGFFQMEF
jgi:hypothetical protein